MVRLIVFILISLVPLNPAWGELGQGLQLYDDLRLNQIELSKDGVLRTTGNDPFLTMDDLDMDRASACFLVLDAEFQEPLFRPRIFELFWATTPGGYSERHKAFVIIDPAQSADSSSYVIPLCKLYGFSGNLHRPDAQQNLKGFRIDLPSNEKVGIKLSSIRFMDQIKYDRYADSGASFITLEPYERLSAKAATSLDVIAPKLVFAFEDGIKHLWKDKPFLFVWLTIMGLLVFRILRAN